MKKLPNANLLYLKIGQTIEHKLEGNLTTGYSWNYVIQDPSIVSIVEHIEAKDLNEKLMGAGSTFNYSLTGLKAGQTTVVFSYRRVWETNQDPIATNTLNIIVKS